MKDYKLSKREIRGHENLYLSRVTVIGRRDVKVEMTDVLRVMRETLCRDDFKMIESFDGRHDYLIIPCTFDAQVELRDSFYTLSVIS